MGRHASIAHSPYPFPRRLGSLSWRQTVESRNRWKEKETQRISSVLREYESSRARTGDTIGGGFLMYSENLPPTPERFLLSDDFDEYQSLGTAPEKTCSFFFS